MPLAVRFVAEAVFFCWAELHWYLLSSCQLGGAHLCSLLRSKLPTGVEIEFSSWINKWVFWRWGGGMNSFALCVFQNKSMGLLQEKRWFILLMELLVPVLVASCSSHSVVCVLVRLRLRFFYTGSFQPVTRLIPELFIYSWIKQQQMMCPIWMIHLSLLEQENQLVWCLEDSTNVTSFKRWGRRLWKNSPGTVQWTYLDRDPIIDS